MPLFAIPAIFSSLKMLSIAAVILSVLGSGLALALEVRSGIVAKSELKMRQDVEKENREVQDEQDRQRGNVRDINAGLDEAAKTRNQVKITGDELPCPAACLVDPGDFH